MSGENYRWETWVCLGVSTDLNPWLGLIARKHIDHLELFAGTAINQSSTVIDGGPDRCESHGIFPVGNIGYRFQKLNGWFFFRSGIGFLNLGYLGIGVAF